MLGVRSRSWTSLLNGEVAFENFLVHADTNSDCMGSLRPNRAKVSGELRQIHTSELKDDGSKSTLRTTMHLE